MQLTNQTFGDVVSSKGLTVVDFWAAWCGPCRSLSPVIDSLAFQYKGKAEIAKLNIDEYRDVAVGFNITSLPTILFFKEGKVIDKLVGAVPRVVIEKKINEYI